MSQFNRSYANPQLEYNVSTFDGIVCIAFGANSGESSPESETNPESTDADLQEETISNLVDGRQTAVESAQWEFDTTFRNDGRKHHKRW